MADATSAPTRGPRKRGSWLRVLFWSFVILMALLVTFYFVLTSATFFKVRILPRVSESIHANVTVGSAEIHPFSEIILRDLKIQPTNQAPVLMARELRARYHLLDIIGGNIRVDEVTVSSPTVQVVENADGTSNLDPLLKAAGRKPALAGRAAKPRRLDIHRVMISNASFLRIQNHSVGTRDLVELTNVDVTLTDVKNGSAGKVEFSAIIRDENNPPAPAMYGLLQAKVDGVFHFDLTPDLKPGQVLGDAHLDISQAAGSFSDFAQLKGALHCDFSPSEIKSITLKFQKDGAQLGELRASGPYDAEKAQGRLDVALLSVDRQVLNLFGAKAGVDFGSTTITLTNQVELSKSGAAISAMGQLSASKFQVSVTNQSTPPIDLRADYDISIDKTEKTALLRVLNVAGTQSGRPLLRAELTSPMTLAWGNKTNAVGDSSFKFAVTKLNLADWKTFAGDLASAGTLDLNWKLLSQEGGRRLTFDATNNIQDLSTDAGGEHLSGVTVSFKTHGQATDLKQFDLSDFGLQLAKSKQTAVAVSGAGTYDRANGSADLQVTLRASIARLLELLGQTNIVASEGTAQLKARVTQFGKTQSVVGDLGITNFTGRLGENAFTNFGTTMTLDVNKTPEQIEIRKATGALSQGRTSAGNFDISGIYSLTNKPSQFSAKLAGLNEEGLRPFVEPLLGGRKLASIAVAGTASAQREPNGDSAIKADLEITNLVVSDPARELPSAPLAAKLEVDAGVGKEVADLRELQITLTPTERARNQFRIKGRVDASKTNAIQGHLAFDADSLDLTSYYELFAATNSASAGAAGTKSGKAAPLPASEAMGTNQLPFKDFAIEANVRQFYLGEIAATNFHAAMNLERNGVRLRPLQLTLNGSPIEGGVAVDLTVPGYKYAVTFDATNAPFAPLWNTFNPEEKGAVGGSLTAVMDGSWVGMTGKTLQKSLTGKFEVGTTNLNLAVDKIHNRMLRMLVALVADLPEIADNPLRATSSLVGGEGGGVLSGELSGDLAKSPIDIVTARGTAGNGRVNLQQVIVRSSVFEGSVTNGTVTLAPVLTNSTIDIPIGISINKSVAQRVANLISADTPTNVDYVKLPDFFSETGTVGNPKPKVSIAALGQAAAQKFIPGMSGGTNGAAGNLLQGLGGLLQGGANTNQPATNRSPANGLLNRLLAPGQ